MVFLLPQCILLCNSFFRLLFIFPMFQWSHSLGLGTKPSSLLSLPVFPKWVHPTFRLWRSFIQCWLLHMYLWPKPFLWARVSYAITYLTILFGYLSNILNLTCLSKTLGSTITLLPKPIICLDFLISVKIEKEEKKEEIVVMEVKE